MNQFCHVPLFLFLSFWYIKNASSQVPAWFFKKGFPASSDHCTILLRIPSAAKASPCWPAEWPIPPIPRMWPRLLKFMCRAWGPGGSSPGWWTVQNWRRFFWPNATPRIHWDERYICRPIYMKSSNINLNVGKYITYHIHGSCEKHHDVQFWNDGFVSTCLLLVMLKRDGVGNHTFAGLFRTLAFWVKH